MTWNSSCNEATGKIMDNVTNTETDTDSVGTFRTEEEL